jgi:hypothetical protein
MKHFSSSLTMKQNKLQCFSQSSLFQASPMGAWEDPFYAGHYFYSIDTCGLYDKHIMILNDASKVINE